MGFPPALPVIPFYTSQRIPCGCIVCYSAGSILETASKEKFLNQLVKCDSLLPIKIFKHMQYFEHRPGRIEDVLMKLKRTDLVSRIANFSSFVVFLLLIVFLIWAATLIQQATSEVKTSTFVSDAYRQLLYTLSKKEALQYEYALHPSIAVRDEYLATSRTLSNLVRVLQQSSDTGDDAVGQRILTQQASYLLYSDQFLSAIDARDFTRANAIQSQEVDPLFNQIDNELTQQTKIEEAETAHALAQLTEVQLTIFVTRPIVFVICLLLLGITTYVARSYRRKLDEVTRTEIA